MEYILWSKVRRLRRCARMTGAARRLISRNLRALRAARSMTQEDVAAAAGMDRSYVSEIETEKYAASADMVEKLAGAFGLEIFEMFHPDTAERAKRSAAQ